MTLISRISIIYFPLAFIYKMFVPSENVATNYEYEYFVNSYWFVTALYFMAIFWKLTFFCIISTHKKIITSVAVYWGIMALLRGYLFFNIELHTKLISSANTITIGAISIVLIFIYLTAVICRQN